MVTGATITKSLSDDDYVELRSRLHNYLASRLLEQQGLIEGAARQDYRVVVRPSTSDRPDSRDPGLIFYIWCDRNGDGIAQPEEVQFIEVPSPQDTSP